MQVCSVCFNTTLDDPCPICSDQTRDQTLIAVVEQPSDVDVLQKSSFKGVYHVLHGVISPRNGIGPNQLRISELIQRVREHHVRQLLICTLDTMEGNATAFSIYNELRSAGLLDNVKIQAGRRRLKSGSDRQV